MMKDRKQRFSGVFRIAVWALFVYMVIAALHGMAPQIWRHHCADGNDNGPFRTLLFSPFTALVMAVFALVLAPKTCHVAAFTGLAPKPAPLSPWLLRGPPAVF